MDDKKFNQLIEKLKNPDAFNVLYEYFYPKTVNHIYFEFGNKHLGEDVAQEYFMKLIKMKINYCVEHPTSWILTSCENIAKDFLSAEKKYDSAYVEDKRGKRDEVYENLIFGEYKDKINSLEEMTRKIVIMHFYEGYSLKEISEILNVNYNTVRQKCSRGLKKLKEI